MTRRRFVTLFTLAAAAFVVALCLWPNGPSTLTRANFDRVQVGMTMDEVEALIGPATVRDMVIGVNLPNNPMVIQYWDAGATYVYVWLDDTGLVSEKQYVEQSISDRLRYWWLRWVGTLPPF